MTDTYSEMLGRWTFDMFLSRVEALEWFATVPDEVRERAKAYAQSLFDQGKRESVFASLAIYAFDTQCIHGIGANHTLSYSTYIRAIMRAAGDPLPLTILEDEAVYDENRNCVGIRIHLVLDGQMHRYRVDNCGHYFDTRVITRWLNSLMKEHGLERQFHLLPAEDQIVRLAFVSEATYRQAAREGLLPYPDYFSKRYVQNPGRWETLVSLYYYLLDAAPLKDSHMDIYTLESEQFLTGEAQYAPVSTAWILKRITDEEAAHRAIAVSEAGRSSNPALFDPLLNALRDPDERVRSAAVNALYRRGDTRAIQPLIRALDDPSLNVVYDILEVIKAWNVTGAYPMLLRLLRTRPEITQKTTTLTNFLAASGSNFVIERCIELLTHTLPEVRKEAIKILKLMRTERAFEPLAAVLRDDPDEEVCSAAMRAVAITGGAAALQPLLDAFERVEPGSFAEFWLWNALGYELKEQALDPMIEWLGSWQSHRRHFAAHVLGAVDHPRSHTALESVMEDVDTLLADFAAVKLGKFGKTVAFERVAQIAQDDLHPLQPNALHALASFGVTSLDTLAAVLESAQDKARQTAIGTVVKIGGEGALALLLKYRDDPLLHNSVKRALKALGYKKSAAHE